MSASNRPADPSPTRRDSDRSRRLGVVALVLGIVALVLAFVPIASYAAGFPAVAALTTGIVAVVRGGGGGRGAGIGGIVLGGIALVAAIAMSVVYTVLLFVSAATGSAGLPDLPSGFPTAVPSVRSLATGPTTGPGGSVVYEVTGTGRASSIAYAAVDAARAGIDRVSAPALPWSRTLAVARASGAQVFSLVVQVEGSDAVTCRILLNGEVLSKETSSGPDGVASCTATRS